MRKSVRNLIVWCILGIVALAVLYAVVTAIPYAYVGLALAVFLAGGGAAWLFLKGRKRVVVIVAVALLSAALVIASRATTRQTLAIVNESDLAVRDLIILLPTGANSDLSLEARNIPPHSEVSASFHSMTYSPNVIVMGHFADGSDISSKAQRGLPVTATAPVSRHAHRRIVIQSDGGVLVLPE